MIVMMVRLSSRNGEGVIIIITMIMMTPLKMKMNITSIFDIHIR